MKKIISIALFAFVFGAGSGSLFAQCNSESFANACIPKLSGGFNFLKSYKVDGVSKDKVEFSYVFTKGTQYMLNVCGGGATDGIVVNILDKDRNKVASSKINGQLVSAIAFPCNATGIYYIQYTFETPSAHCGGSALGFKKG